MSATGMRMTASTCVFLGLGRVEPMVSNGSRDWGLAGAIVVTSADLRKEAH